MYEHSCVCDGHEGSDIAHSFSGRAQKPHLPLDDKCARCLRRPRVLSLTRFLSRRRDEHCSNVFRHEGDAVRESVFMRPSLGRDRMPPGSSVHAARGGTFEYCAGSSSCDKMPRFARHSARQREHSLDGCPATRAIDFENSLSLGEHRLGPPCHADPLEGQFCVEDMSCDLLQGGVKVFLFANLFSACMTWMCARVSQAIQVVYLLSQTRAN